MKIALAQVNPCIGDIKGNYAKVKAVYTRYAKQGVDIVVFPELVLIGSPPRDLLYRKWLIDEVEKVTKQLEQLTGGFKHTALIVGVPVRTGSGDNTRLLNSAIVLFQGKIVFSQSKTFLPSYDVFDETRYFYPVDKKSIFVFKGKNIGISVGEDTLNVAGNSVGTNYYNEKPVGQIAGSKPDLMINISASPYYLGKERTRYDLVKALALKYRAPLIYVNQVGGNDELIFDGQSLCISKHGKVLAKMPAFVETVKVVDTDTNGIEDLCLKWDVEMELLYNALVLGIRDYVNKNGFSKITVGLSGGIDSTVVACLAVEAVGRENVLGITMPSIFSSKGSVKDSKILAAGLGIEFKVVPITEVYNAYLNVFRKQFRGAKPDITEENVQARIRGNLLMAFSNKYGYLLLSTGNKSELAVGYCTLYGDMSGGLAVISDVPKTMVYRLAEYINIKNRVIPKSVFTKPPSAELRANQTDQDTLPPYNVLDQILYFYIDENCSPEEIVSYGYNKDTVKWVTRTVDKNEFKRRQAAPGLKVTSKAFGTGRRMVIAAKYY
ncbi:MAG: NAD+ synthase [Elusimicrobiota bacterium]